MKEQADRLRFCLQAHPRRNFDPTKARRYGRPTLDPDRLVKYSPKWEYSRLFNYLHAGKYSWRPRMRTIVIATDGGSRGNNRADPTSRAAYGVYFGKNCLRNAHGLVSRFEPQTSSRAELEAVRVALKTVAFMRQGGTLEGWREVIIKLDSDYVARSLSDYVWKWEQNGYMNARRKKVEHADLIREIHETIKELEEEGAVRFWTVRGEWNKEADLLVNQALDDAGADSGYDD